MALPKTHFDYGITAPTINGVKFPSNVTMYPNRDPNDKRVMT